MKQDLPFKKCNVDASYNDNKTNTCKFTQNFRSKT